jgi:hypothetical protein
VSEGAILVQAVLGWGCATVNCEFLAAHPGSEERWLEIADVIVGGGVAGCRHGDGTSCLHAFLARYPGCVVAAASNARSCAVLTRGGAVDRFDIGRHHHYTVLATATLVHCWLAADWSRAAMRRARFTSAKADLQPGLSGWLVRGQADGSPLSLVMSVLPVASALSASSWLRTGATSGVPSSS